MILSDPSAERAVLAGICTYGEDAFLDVADIIQESSFTIDSNALIFKCVKKLCESETKTKIDIASIYSIAQELSLSHVLSKKEEAQHLRAVMDFPVSLENVRKFAAKIRKLEIARLLRQQLELAQEKILDVTGSEPISSIIGLAEDSIFNFTSLLNDADGNPETIGLNIDEYIKALEENKIDQVGIPTGFPIYDQAIGGGLRKGTINVIGARPKIGKTLLSDNMGKNIAALGIPVLNMDTEMNKEDHIHRILAMMTEIEINNIETGKFAETADSKTKILQAGSELKGMKLYHKSIAGKPFEDQLAVMRRWLVKEVGLNDDGTAKECVIFYDYLKLMDSAGISQDMKEYQVLGFMMTSLHNFAVRYKVPIVAFIQLNRDGITKESTDSASGSDRIIWLCSNFTIFKRKSDEEIAEDGPINGNRKLLPLISRHGGGLDDNDYINCHMKGWCAKITEGKTRLQIINNKSTSDQGFIVD
ncbi:MAG: DnaB-like helicase C-terminal domain-containing protein, partial [Candidatus Paceibacterota bacterium]